ncbi:MAG: ribosome biogenesis GTP-binding protein YihA/YsxC, partial [Desulfonatronovibrionaceae bacterium]
LINCLAQSGKLARTSSTPGKTRSINFFHVQPGDFFMVDLPGYGYAKCSKQERGKWAGLMQDYLSGSPHIRGMVLITDSRLTPQPLDVELASFAKQYGFDLLLVLTKSDKSRQKERSRALNAWKRLFPEAGEPILFSAKTGRGREALWLRILELAGVSSGAPFSG